MVFVLGGPGAGKGTQCERLALDLSVPHISAGDVLRRHVQSGSEDDRQLAAVMQNGQIVPSHVRNSAWDICCLLPLLGARAQLLRELKTQLCMEAARLAHPHSLLARAPTVSVAQVTIGLLQREMLKRGGALHLIDGFPRNLENARAWSAAACVEPSLVLNLVAGERELERRLLQRGQGRSDDNAQTIRKRFQVR